MLAAELQAQTKLSSYRRVLIFRSTSLIDPQSGLPMKSQGMSGYLTAVEGDTLHVLTASGEESIARGDISKVILRGEAKSGKGLGYGMLLGGYASLYLLGARDENGTFLHPSFNDNPFVIMLAVFPGMAIGAGIGYVIDPASEASDELIEIHKTDHANQDGWHRLEENLNPRHIGKIHFSVQGSHLYNFIFNDQSVFDYGRSSSNFNLVRKLQCTYSFTPQIEAGIAWAPFGTLGVDGYRYEYTAPGTSRNLQMNKTISATGYYIVGQYKPLSHGLSERFDLNVGGGIGWMSIDYQRTISGNISTYDNSNYTNVSLGPFPFAISSSELSGMIYSEIAMQVYDGLTFGLILDRLFVESVSDPGEPWMGYTPSPINLGTWSFGINLGVHY